MTMENGIDAKSTSGSEEPSRPSIIVPGEQTVTLSWFQLEQETKLLQQKLAATSTITQQTVIIALANSVEFVSIYLAITKQRGIAAPLNPSNKENEFSFYLEDVKAAMIIVPKGASTANSDPVRAAKKYGCGIAECYWDGQTVVLDIVVQKEQTNGQKKAAPSIEPLDTDVALLLHTGGTTGKPKAVPLTHKNLNVSARNISKAYHLGEDDKTMMVMPLYHVAGFFACLATLYSRGAIILPPRYSPKTFWEDLTEHNVTWYTSTPTMYRLILQLPPPKVMPPRLRFIRSSASPLPPALLRELESKFQIPVVDAYGITEGASFVASNPLPPGLQIAGSVGIPQAEISIRDPAGAPLNAGDEGEICIRGEMVMKGYLNAPDANAQAFTPDGFFRTGDFGYVDANNYVFITGRIKEFINKGGEKVSPVELDNIVMQHPAVAEAAAFAVEDDIYGQDVGLAVTLKSGEKFERSKLKRWIRDRVSAHKVPVKIFTVQELPKSATGKIQRTELSKQAASGNLASAT